MKKHRIEILIGIISVLVAIVAWLFPPEPLRKILGINQTEVNTQKQVKTPLPVPKFTGSVVNEDYSQPETQNGPADFMDFIENHVGEKVYFDLEVGSSQMDQLNQPTLEGDSKVCSMVVKHPTLNYWFEIDITVEPFDDFFYGPISVAFGQLRGTFRIMGRYGIGTGLSGFELQAMPSS